jgi:hypothetical protein
MELVVMVVQVPVAVVVEWLLVLVEVVLVVLVS